MSALTLTADELRDLTGKQRPSAQARALNAMGIEFKRRADGTVAVDRGHYERVMEGGTPKPRKKAEPAINWT
jgi:hypothetical protein